MNGLGHVRKGGSWITALNQGTVSPNSLMMGYGTGMMRICFTRIQDICEETFVELTVVNQILEVKGNFRGI